MGNKGKEWRSTGKRDAGGRDRVGAVLCNRAKQRNDDSEGSETDESVRNIPMPRDTPPAMPVRHNRGREQNHQHVSGANTLPLGQGLRIGSREPLGSQEKLAEPQVQAKTIYVAQPAVRDLRKEAVGRFVPAIVQRKIDAKKGTVVGKLLEEEELEKLEQEGYGERQNLVASRMASTTHMAQGQKKSESIDQLEAGEERFGLELKHTRIGDIEDADAQRL